MNILSKTLAESLLLIISLIESLLHNLSREHLLADAHGKRSVKSATFPLHEGEADALAQRDAVVASGHNSDLCAVLKLDRIAGARNGLVRKLDAHELHLGAVGLLVSDGLLADELVLVQFAEHAETGGGEERSPG